MLLLLFCCVHMFQTKTKNRIYCLFTIIFISLLRLPRPSYPVYQSITTYLLLTITNIKIIFNTQKNHIGYTDILNTHTNLTRNSLYLSLVFCFRLLGLTHFATTKNGLRQCLNIHLYRFLYGGGFRFHINIIFITHTHKIHKWYSLGRIWAISFLLHLLLCSTFFFCFTFATALINHNGIDMAGVLYVEIHTTHRLIMTESRNWKPKWRHEMNGSH